MTSFFHALLEIDFYASILILIVLLLRFFLKKAPKSLSLLLWAVVGLRLLFPFSLESPLAFVPNAGDLFPRAETERVKSPLSDRLPSTAPFETAPLTDPFKDETVVPFDSTAHPPDESEASFGQVETPAPFPVFYLLTCLWAIGVFSMLLYAFLSSNRLKKKLRSALPCEDNVYLSGRIAAPFIFGILSPKIYLPYPIDQEEIPLILLHEQTHIRRGDHVTKPLAFFLLTFHWFNPLVWIAYRFFCRDVEFSCDESVISRLGSRKEYSRSLLKYAVSPSELPLSSAGFGEENVKKRVKNILSYQKPALWISVLLLLVCLAVSLPFFLHRPPTEGEQESNQAETASSSSGLTPDEQLALFMPKEATERLFCDPLGKDKDHYLLAFLDANGEPLYYTAKAKIKGVFVFAPFTPPALPKGYEDAYNFLPLYVLNREDSVTSELVIRFQTREGVRYQICAMNEVKKPNGERLTMWYSTVLLRTDFLSLYQPKETAVTTLNEDIWRFALNYDGILTDAAYQLLFDMVSGQSATHDYNLFTIDRYTIERDGDNELSFDFHVSESTHDTVGVGDYQTVLCDYVEPMLEGLHEFKRVDFNAFGEFSDREEAWMVAEWLLSRYHWRVPDFGKAKEKEVSNYLCRYYGNGKLPFEEYQKLAKEKFGIENPTAADVPQMQQNGELFVYSGDLGGQIRYEVKNVRTVGDDTEVTVRFYADINRIVKSHLVTYVLGEGGVWKEMRIDEESAYPPLGLM